MWQSRGLFLVTAYSSLCKTAVVTENLRGDVHLFLFFLSAIIWASSCAFPPMSCRCNMLLDLAALAEEDFTLCGDHQSIMLATERLHKILSGPLSSFLYTKRKTVCSDIFLQ
jgi:hypothetical protein